MPALPLRKRLLHSILKYAKHVQALRQWVLELQDDHMSSVESFIAVDEFDLEPSNQRQSDLSSLSSVSSISCRFPWSQLFDGVADAQDELYLKNLAQIREHIVYLENTRVLNPNIIHKLSQLYLVLELYKKDDEKCFRHNLRVSPETFDEILKRIQDHHVFVSEGPHDQFPIDKQLVIALFWFGHFGNAASVESVGQWAGVALHDEYIRWPSAAEKEAAKEWVEAASCAAWRDGWLLVDGTLVPLSDKPGFHGEAYFDRKSNYSLNIQLITLPNLRIIDYVIGHTGSCHDSTAFAGSCVYRHHATLLTGREWIWADSVYPIEAWCVTPFKKPASLLQDNKTFNFWVSHVRIRSEHAVGYLKGRWQSLRGLRQQIKNAVDHQ
ncbi:DDE Tnp4 domain-containing protein [Mycena indigotica]|uniref:DDE Tnp4 domain-containing protein n=1 Tax=Mycena indigotica TaxID=2126181 RepID=A0A8H6S201_9AGAR|nr:DDE Tnp4 domain-containing protein [Mycena indigotica]KAF7291261.1 DDE Tnp4 domain-containing protein [Mycena indigotica]